MEHTPRNIQSPYTAADFWEQWSSINPRMCLCIKVTSAEEFGSDVRGFTSNTRDMTLPGHVGVVFKSSPGILSSILEQGLDEASNVNFTGIYNSDSFDHDEVMAEKWNFAEIEIFSVCWDNVDLGEFLHSRCKLGEFKDHQTDFVAEGRGLIAQLSQDMSQVTQKLCRAPEFCDPVFCRKDPNSTVTIDAVEYNITETTTVATFVGDEHLQVAVAGFAGNIPPENFYANGKITAITGANAGVSREIAYSGSQVFTYLDIRLKRVFPFDFEGGDEVSLRSGCDFTPESCFKYENSINFRGEPWIPGVESVNRLPTAQ